MKEMIAVKDIIKVTGMSSKTLLRGGLPTSGHVSTDKAINFLTPFAEPFGRWEAAKAAKTKELLRSIQSGEPIVLGLNGKHLGDKDKELKPSHKPDHKPSAKPSHKPKPISDPSLSPTHETPKTEDITDVTDVVDAPKTDKGILINTIMHINFLSVVLVLGFLAQVGHTIGFVQLTVKNEWSYLDALSIDLMAIVLSAKTKNTWYLVGGLIIHVLMNLTYYDSLEGGITWSNAMLGVIVALANFSFAELIITAAKDSKADAPEK